MRLPISDHHSSTDEPRRTAALLPTPTDSPTRLIAPLARSTCQPQAAQPERRVITPLPGLTFSGHPSPMTTQPDPRRCFSIRDAPPQPPRLFNSAREQPSSSLTSRLPDAARNNPAPPAPSRSTCLPWTRLAISIDVTSRLGSSPLDPGRLAPATTPLGSAQPRRSSGQPAAPPVTCHDQSAASPPTRLSVPAQPLSQPSDMTCPCVEADRQHPDLHRRARHTSCWRDVCWEDAVEGAVCCWCGCVLASLRTTIPDGWTWCVETHQPDS